VLWDEPYANLSEPIAPSGVRAVRAGRLGLVLELVTVLGGLITEYERAA
jgi:hypothetical protein